jgi:uncharacterized protein (DUF1800 family)
LVYPIAAVQLRLRQNRLLRQHAVGNYGHLLRAVIVDAAMLIFPDGRNNHKARANENLSHFPSGDLWENGSKANQFLTR